MYNSISLSLSYHLLYRHTCITLHLSPHSYKTYILVGDRSDSKAYVRMKKVAANKIGLHTIDKDLPETITQADLIEIVQNLNSDPLVMWRVYLCSLYCVTCVYILCNLCL